MKDEQIDRQSEPFQRQAEQRLLHDVEVCQWQGCGAVLDPRKLTKSGRKRRQRYCNNACASAARKARGFYGQLAKLGNAAQQAYKAKQGVVPGYEQRKAALQKPDRTNNRRRKHES